MPFYRPPCIATLAAVLLTACGGGTTAPAVVPPVPPPPTATLAIGGRSASLPVGYQTQLFVSGANAAGVAQTNRSVAWTSSNSAVVTVDPNGVITATGEGSARVTVTAADGAIASTTITAAVAPLAASARVGFSTALGVPADSDPADDLLLVRRLYTVSYNPRRGAANWVAWNLDASHLGASARCNCFTADTALARLGQPVTTTNDWINGGEYSRGHLVPSADRTSSDGDNAATFFLTNMLPQRPDLNGGPWAGFESFLRTLATGGRQLYVVAGGIWTRNRSGPGVDGLGVMPGAPIVIPDSMWKVAVVVPDTRTATQIVAPAEVQVYAVKMPNVNGIASVPYTTYLTSVDAIQRSTGYDLLSAIPAAVQCVLEQRSCAAGPGR